VNHIQYGSSQPCYSLTISLPVATETSSMKASSWRQGAWSFCRIMFKLFSYSTATKWNFFKIITKLSTLQYFTACVEFVTDRVWGQTCDYVHRTVIIANMCNFIWAGNKPPRVAGNVTCRTVRECEKCVSRYARECDVFLHHHIVYETDVMI
jgi:hypothetical protein